VIDRLVLDASAVVALLLDAGPDGEWVSDQVSGAALSAPALMPFEAVNSLRSLELGGHVEAGAASQAHADLLDLDVELWPHHLVAGRVWKLRSNLTAYDASYVALAEMLVAPLLTLDRRIARAPGLACEIRSR
jgi:predicted nucleic acid-binding protein